MIYDYHTSETNVITIEFLNTNLYLYIHNDLQTNIFNILN